MENAKYQMTVIDPNLIENEVPVVMLSAAAYLVEEDGRVHDITINGHLKHELDAGKAVAIGVGDQMEGFLLATKRPYVLGCDQVKLVLDDEETTAGCKEHTNVTITVVSRDQRTKSINQHWEV